MQLVINGKEYNFKFGIKFVREMDRKYNVTLNGAVFGTSMDTVARKLFIGDVTALVDVLAVASLTENPKVKVPEIEEYIETTEDIEALFDKVTDELRASNATKLGFTKVSLELEGTKNTAAK